MLEGGGRAPDTPFRATIIPGMEGQAVALLFPETWPSLV